MRTIMKSPAFRDGFTLGFTSMFTLISPQKNLRIWEPRDTFAQSWEEIGHLINDAYAEEGKKCGKVTRSTKRFAA